MSAHPRVMLIDDEAHVRLFLKSLLRQAHVDVVAEAGRGEEALQKYAEEIPDLVLLDINMPGMTGTEILEALLANDPNARVIMLTSITDEASIKQCLEAGAINYIRKDTPVEQIRELVRQALEPDGEKEDGHA